jgi:lipoprotein-releasing system permease protein
MAINRFIALRYLTTRQKPFFVSFLLWISVIGVALGTFALVFVLSIMKGFQQDFQQKILGFNAPITLESKVAPQQLAKSLQAISSITSISPVIEGEMIIKTEEGSVAGIKVRGIEAEDSPIFSQFDFFYGEEWDHKNLAHHNDQLPGVIIGQELAADLQIHPDFFDEITLTFPLGDVGPTGELMPRTRRFRVIGLFKTGFYEYDNKVALIDFRAARKLLGSLGHSTMAIGIDNIHHADQVASEIRREMGDVFLSTWQEQHQKLFAALKLERLGMLILLSMIILLSAMTLFGLISIVTTEKAKDMAVLQVHGVTPASVRKIFLFQGGVLGVLGTFIGIVLALILEGLLYYYPIQLPPSYYVEFLPIAFSATFTIGVALLAPLVCLLAALYPAYQVAQRGVVEVLHYE